MDTPQDFRFTYGPVGVSQAATMSPHATQSRELSLHPFLEVFESFEALVRELKPLQSMNYLWVIDSQVARLEIVSPWIYSLSNPLLLPHPAESAKSWSFLEVLLDQMLERDCQGIVAIGGGACLDVGALAAHLYKRGVAWVGVPTTLLAMVDAGLGGKCAVNWRGYKNMVGALHQPTRLLTSYVLLGGDCQGSVIQGGLIEAYKHALIASYPLHSLIKEWIRDPRMTLLHELVPLAALIKLQVVELDALKEWKGVRHLLNLGHTVAHALEWIYAEQALPGMNHARAVAVGLLVESQLYCDHFQRNEAPSKSPSDVSISGVSLIDTPLNEGACLSMCEELASLIGQWPNLSSDQWQLCLMAMQKDKKAEGSGGGKIPLSKFGPLYKMVVQQSSYIVECTHQEMTDAWQVCQRRMAADLY